MRITIQLSAESQRTIRRWRERRRQFLPAMDRGAARGAELLAGKIAEEELGEGGVLRVVTGMLRRSIEGRVLAVGDPLIIGIGVLKGPASKYARIHEKGGTIRAKGGGALAVPLPAARTPSGRPRFPHGPKEAAEKHPDMFMLKRRGKPPLLCVPKRVGGRSGGKVKAIIPLFILLRSVQIPRRQWLSGGVRKHIDVFRVAMQGKLTALLTE